MGKHDLVPGTASWLSLQQPLYGGEERRDIIISRRLSRGMLKSQRQHGGILANMRLRQLSG